MAESHPIGLFDSGVGGLSVLKEIKSFLPKETFVFLADQAHVPYGRKTQDQLQKLSGRITKFLLARNINLLVIACNTATCYVLSYLREKFDIPIVGVVPALKPASKITKNNKIAVMSTPATAKSTYLKDLSNKFAKGKEILLLGCKGLEEAVEVLDQTAIKNLLDKYTKQIKDFGADTIVLGCTHYPFLKEEIQQIVGKDIEIIDSGKAIAKRVEQVLKDRNNFNSTHNYNNDEFYTTGDPEKFSQVASKLLKYRVAGKKAYI